MTAQTYPASRTLGAFGLQRVAAMNVDRPLILGRPARNRGNHLVNETSVSGRFRLGSLGFNVIEFDAIVTDRHLLRSNHRRFLGYYPFRQLATSRP